MKQMIRRWLGVKESQARIALTMNQVGQPQTSPKNYESYYTRGYENNVVAYRCVSLIAEACGGIEWEVYSKRQGADAVEMPDHPLQKLIDRPNPMQARSAFIEAVVAYKKLTGNSFIEAVGPSPKSPPMELWPVRPDVVKIIPDAKGYPARYEITQNNVTKTFPVNPVTLKAMLMQWKAFHPTNPWWGQSPLAAAMLALDQNNAGQRWNLALLQNGASPSGVLQVVRSDANPSGVLTPEQFKQLQDDLDESFSGPRNAGRPMLLEGGLEWKQMGLGPKEMDFLKSKDVTAIDVCTVFGVPPEMLGLGQKTFNNYKEARMSFYEDTVLPTMDGLATELNHWAAPMFGEGIYLCYDKDDIEALAPKREAKFTSLKDANFLKLNEKRVAAGYEPVEGGDVFIINNEVVENPEDLAVDLADEETPPVPDEENAADLDVPEEEVDDEDDVDEETDDEEKSWKSFNLLNANERRAAWKRQTWRKTRLERSFERDLASDLKELSRDLESAMKSSTDPRTREFALLKAIDENMETVEKTLKRHISYTVQDFGDATFNSAKEHLQHVPERKSKRQWDDWAKRYIATRTGKAIGEIAGTTKKKVTQVVKRLTEQALIDGISNDEMASELRDTFSSLSKSRAKLIAQQEVQMASQSAAKEAVKSLQIPGMVKEWISAKDDRVRTLDNTNGHADHEVMDGVEVPLDEKFNVPPDSTMDGPGDPSAPLEQIMRCRCVLGFKSRNTGEL